MAAALSYTLARMVSSGKPRRGSPPMQGRAPVKVPEGRDRAAAVLGEVHPIVPKVLQCMMHGWPGHPSTPMATD